MDLKQYVSDAIRTESIPDTLKVNPHLLASAMSMFISAGTILDKIKKNAFYGKEIDMEVIANHFRDIIEALDNLNSSDITQTVELTVNPRVFHSIIGIATEATELMEGLDLSGKNTDNVNLLEEFGDISWYEAVGIDALEGDFEKVLTNNIDKLKKRYPEKFDNDKAINRDTIAEREILKQ